MGDTLIPDVVTDLLSVNPDHAHAKGDPVPGRPGRYYHTGFWGISSQFSNTVPLEKMIEDLLERIEPKIESLDVIRGEGWSMSFFCGFFARSDAGELIELSTALMNRMATLGIRIVIDVYPDCED